MAVTTDFKKIYFEEFFTYLLLLILTYLLIQPKFSM